MKRTLGLIALYALANLFMEPAMAADKTPSPGETVLYLSAAADRAMAADQLRAVLTIEASGDTLGKVQEDIKRRMAAARDRVHQSASIKERAGGLNLFEDKSGKAWRGSQSLTLKSAEFADLLTLTSELRKSGLEVNEFSYELSEAATRKLADELTTEALLDLRRRASLIAGDLGGTVKELRIVTIGNADIERHDVGSYGTKESSLFSSRSYSVSQQGREAVVSVTAKAEILIASAKP